MTRQQFLGLAFTASVGCQRSGRKTVAVIPKGTSHIFWLGVEAGARQAGKDFDLDVEWNGPAQETEYARQIQIMDSMVSRKVDGIALAATERQALIGPVDRARAAGIPLVVFDSGLDTQNYDSFVATDNYAAGGLAARTLGGLVGKQGEIAILRHVPGAVSTMDRERGFTDAIAKEFPGLKLVGDLFGMSDRAKALAAAENILTAHPGLNGLFTSTEPSSVGAALAVQQRGLAGKVKFVAFDSSDTLVTDLKGGVISALVVQDPFKMGYEAVHCLSLKLQGKTPPKRVDLSAQVIRADDLTKPEVQRLLDPRKATKG